MARLWRFDLKTQRWHLVRDGEAACGYAAGAAWVHGYLAPPPRNACQRCRRAAGEAMLGAARSRQRGA